MIDEVTPSHKPESDDMVSDKFVIIFARFFETKDEDDELLAPVCGLHKVVTFELGFHVPVRVVNPKGFSAVPIRRELGHNAISPSTHATKVDKSVSLLAKPINLSWFPQSKVSRQRLKDLESEGLADEGPENNIVSYKDEVPPVLRIAGVLWGRG